MWRESPHLQVGEGSTEEYSIVGESLLQAMKDVLGQTATEEVMTAWTEAYQALSEVFVKREHQIYKEQVLI